MPFPSQPGDATARTLINEGAARVQLEVYDFESFNRISTLPTDQFEDNEAGLIEVTFEEVDDRMVRRSMTATLTDAEEWLPFGLTDTTSPLRQNLAQLFWDFTVVKRPENAVYWQHLPEFANLPDRIAIGTYVLDTVEATLEADRTVTVKIDAADNMQMFADVAIPNPVEIPEGTDPVIFIAYMVALIDPNSTIFPTTTTNRIGKMSWEIGTSFLQIMADAAQAGILRVFTDEEGQYYIEPPPASHDDFGTDTFYGYDSESPDLLSASRGIRRSGIINGVIVRGEVFDEDTPPVEGRVWVDNGALSYGDHPDFESALGPMPLVIIDRSISTEQEAKTLAAARLAEKGGVPEFVTLEVLSDHRRLAGDVMPLAITEIGAEGDYFVRSVSMRQTSSAGSYQSVMTLVLQDRRPATSEA
jgi:hypothetical protein